MGSLQFAPMFEMPLPTRIDLNRISRQSQHLLGELRLEALPRLQDLFGTMVGNIAVDLTVAVDNEGYKFIEGHVKTVISLQCQRCLEEFDYSLTAEFCLSPVLDEQQAETLPEQYEAVVLEDKHINIEKMIEDEIILNLPLVAMHPNEHC